mmetsp:Transcript_19747/g.55801  ORF Transcript_19747/g.55801 Transcript_19747/m.55801 type:complete len:123 (+) Transcript_19747:91-459(+)|eukprot:CAMPEP_0119558236 /NCGR_PEP_ID=MMETSP1352-20130426/10415_1 /TAXON_ID=265584 /ORGANISM="Stauroneis constricta, Strain CCMP1120" /LENGTH=122 /DNA_ID=CAMNT_0007605531 /DNA_START=85 /DNA_END=453 /DNA_ORIENTATION=+
MNKSFSVLFFIVIVAVLSIAAASHQDEYDNRPLDLLKQKRDEGNGGAEKVVIGTMGKGDKSSWPEVVGMSGEDAKAAILADDDSLKVQVVPEGSMMTMDYRLDRVRVFVDSNGKVTQEPRLG